MAGTFAEKQKSELINNDLRYKNCPLCRSVQIHMVGKVDYGPCVKFSTHNVKPLLTPELWNCFYCKSGFMQNIFPEKVAEGLYESGMGSEKWISIPETEKTSKVIDSLKELFVKGRRVLDIGCNTGEILDLAKANDCDTVGIDYCINSVEAVRKKGHSCFLKIDDVPGKFDIIIGFDLVEHLYDISNFLDACFEKLTPEGRLFLLTGDIRSLSARLTGADWWYVRYPEHIVFPSKKFFMSYQKFIIERWLHTYAYVGHMHSTFNVFKGFLKGVIKGTYTGLPSLGPDHVMAILRKK